MSTRPAANLAVTAVALASTAVWVVGDALHRANSEFDLQIALTYLPTIVLSAILILRASRRRPLSLNVMHLLFIFSHWGLAATAQYLRSQFPFTEGLALYDRDLLRANAVMVLWLVAYALAYGAPASVTESAVLSRGVTSRGIVALVVCSVAAFVALAAWGNFGRLTRGSSYPELQRALVGTELLTVSLVKGMPIVALASLLVLAKTRRTTMRWGLVVCFAIPVVLLDNPLAAARWWTGMVVIGIGTIWARRQLGKWLVPGMMVATFLLMSLLNEGRYANSADAYTEWKPAESISDSVAHGDFESYSTVLRTLWYIDGPGITWGRQLLGGALFWVPRAVWPEKPLGSGWEVAAALQYDFRNLGATLPAEGLINFGYFGVVLFAFLFGRILRRMDDLYWAEGNVVTGRSRLIDHIYPFWLGIIFFVTRGDLLVGCSFLAAITGSALPLLVFSERPRSLGRDPQTIRQGNAEPSDRNSA